tara:strand:- start:11820 stop:12773 length:954 start_codon:yes stop_codon:yes gene_type:complete
MPKHRHSRKGSLQFYPRVRAKKILPRVSWDFLSKDEGGLLGFIGYKAGMKSAYVRDNTQNSLTKGQRIIIPITIIECPLMKIFSIRFYKNKKVIGEVLNSNIDKELKKKIKTPKAVKKKIGDFKEDDYDDIRVLVYTDVKKTGIKKSPDIAEIGLSGSVSEKLEFVKTNLTKEISIKDVFKESVVDVRGVTKGKGTQGPTKRFGLSLRSHKSEKGVRGPGSGGPWHPARVEYTQPMAGQMGYFTRVVYNNKIIEVNDISEKNINPKSGFKKYGKIKTDFLIVQGSIQGPVKRQLLITAPLRASKKQTKKNYELIEIR